MKYVAGVPITRSTICGRVAVPMFRVQEYGPEIRPHERIQVTFPADIQERRRHVGPHATNCGDPGIPTFL
jgi:hypothetical protein